MVWYADSPPLNGSNAADAARNRENAQHFTQDEPGAVFAGRRRIVAAQPVIDLGIVAYQRTPAARKDVPVRKHTPTDDAAIRVMMLRQVAAVVDGVSLGELIPGHFYELPARAARYVIQREAGFEVPAAGDDTRTVPYFDSARDSSLDARKRSS